MNKYIVFTILVFSFAFVKADEISLNIVCPKEEILINEKIKCDVMFNSNISVSSISFNYSSDLLLDFSENENYTENNRNVSILYNVPLELTKETTILKIEISSKNSGDSYINLNNIILNGNISLDDISKKIYVKRNNVLSNNNKLSDITVNGVSVSNFDPDVNRYEDIIVNKPIAFIDIKGKDDNAMVTGVGSVMIKKGIPTEVNIRVTSEDGNINIYTLVITYQQEVVKSRDDSIEMIELFHGNKRLDFTFDKNKSSFRIKLDSNVDKVSIKATLTDSKAVFIEGYGPRVTNLDYGENFVELRVESENGDIKIYSINIERTDDRNTDNTLKELIINDSSINIDKNVFDYKINVPFDNLETVVIAKANNEKAVVDYKNIELVEGNNTFVITVTAENGKSREYNIDIIRGTNLDDITLPDITDNSEANILADDDNKENPIKENSNNNVKYFVYIGLFSLAIIMVITFIVIKRKKK